MKRNWYVNLLNRIIILIAPGYHVHRDPPTAEEKKKQKDKEQTIKRVEDYT